MAKNGKAKASKGTKAKAAKPVKAVDQEIKGKKAAAPAAEKSLSPNQVKKIINDFADRYNTLLDEKESTNGTFMEDARELIQDASNDTGYKKRLVAEALRENRRLLKKQRKDADRDRAELEQRDTLEDLLGHFEGDNLFQAAVDREKKTKASRSSGQGRVVPMPQREGDGETHEEAPAAA